jgi:hypothetical protein
MLPNILCMQSQWPTVSGWLRIIPNSSARWKSISNVHILYCIYICRSFLPIFNANLHCIHLKLLAAKQPVRPSFVLMPVWKHCVLHCTENRIYVFPEKELHNSYIHVSVRYLYIPRMGPHIWLQQNRQTDSGNI